MINKTYIVFLAVLFMTFLTACGTIQTPDSSSEVAPSASQRENTEESPMHAENQTTKAQGAMSPEDALEYMKNTPDLVIVEANAQEWKLSNGITGAMWIPYTEMAERYDEIPKGCPVLIHCGGGIVSAEAYETLQEKRPDISELSYIAGAPPVNAYNEWLANQ